MKTEPELEDGLYTINGKHIYYWQDGEWWEAVKYMGRYSGNIRRLSRQPKRIKTIERYHTIY